MVPGKGRIGLGETALDGVGATVGGVVVRGLGA